MTETEFPCGAYDSRTAKNENKQMPDKDINNKDKIQMEQSGVSGLESVISPSSGYADATLQKIHPSIKKDTDGDRYVRVGIMSLIFRINR